MFAAATVFCIFTLSANYGILLYSGAPYQEVPLIDWKARSTTEYFQCTADNFVNFSAFGFIVRVSFMKVHSVLQDFVGLAIGVGAGLVEFINFIITVCTK